MTTHWSVLSLNLPSYLPGIHPSVSAAYKAKAASLNVSRGALYQKLNGVELAVSAALVRETASELGALIGHLGGNILAYQWITRCGLSMAMRWRRPSIACKCSALWQQPLDRASPWWCWTHNCA